MCPEIAIKVCQWSHLNTIITGFLYFQNNFASLAMDILAILALCTDKIIDLLKLRHHKESISSKKLDLNLIF